ncbi:EamA family transporter [Vibrio sp. VB16]|uniref:EamA family transporter n=1 Tax=Vibrio sp. VB16 TaxID=2785746 RepID=UPI0018A0C023|nr:EamA family transporter [Vibrio sp. VB16]UGA53517.1 EamA family transporter [Vibrio sp. VB16]
MAFWPSIIIIVSAIMHAGWNVLGKSNSHSRMAFFLASSVTAALILTPYLIWFVVTVGIDALENDFWLLLISSGVFQMIYLLGLAYAYRQADISVIYPIARALPVLMVGFGTVLMGYSLSYNEWFGFILITAGCLFVPLSQFGELKLKAYLNFGVFWALFAAIGTTGYSIIDKEALADLNILVSIHFPSYYSAVFYLGIQYWAICASLCLWLLLSNNKQEFLIAWSIRKRSAVAGIMMSSTYGLVLFAMTMTDNVSYVVALRQISIVFGLGMGIYFLKEKWYLTRGVGVACITSGLIIALCF